jgi:hypothetical protein
MGGQGGQGGQQGKKAPGAEQVRKAVPDQDDAFKNLEQNKRDDAANNQGKAVDKLLEAQKELEKRLKQLREEELERLLANLEQRVNKMLAMQKEVLAHTIAIHEAVQRNKDMKPTPADNQKAQVQSDAEAAIIGEADKAIDLLRNEGSAVAFPQVFEEVRKDMVVVKNWLYDSNVGAETQDTEKDIIKQLENMRDALKKAQQDLKKDPGPPGEPKPGGGKQEQKLLDEIAELKLIKALQEQVNDRTTRYGRRYQGEQADDPQTRTLLRELGERQERIEQMVRDVVTGRNK